MIRYRIDGGLVHTLPSDLRKALTSDSKALVAWKSLTPLARNEWICWMISVKTIETRNNHAKRIISELKEGIRRPCCWVGCVHRTDKKVSRSVQWILNKQVKKK